MGNAPQASAQSNPPLGIFSLSRSVIITLLTVIALVIVSFVVYANIHTTVTLTVDGETREVSTFVGTVGELLKEQGVTYDPHDRLSAKPEGQLKEDMNIALVRATAVHITADGKTEKVFTHQGTVQEVLNENNITLNPLDKIEPALDAEIANGSEIVLVRVTEEIVEQTEKLKYSVVRKADSSMKKGQEKIIQKGEEGELKHRFIVTYEDGVEVKREPLGTDVIKNKLDNVVAFGTLETVSRGGYDFVPRKTLNNVTLTAYSAGVEHTGKKPGDKGYGKTRTGTTVTDGRTIAVDPKVIPLGWWVWIEGVGLRKAEDTGGAVKGNKIDVYMSDNDAAHKFGLKKGYTVHVIGPNKPGN